MMISHSNSEEIAKPLARVLAILNSMPDEAIKNRQVGYAIGELWRKHISSSVEHETYLELWDRMWSALANDPPNDENRKDPVDFAINNSAGTLTEKLFEYLWPKNAKVGGGLPIELTDRIKLIVQRTDHNCIDASSVIVASRAETLHAVDPDFTKQTVIPLFSWGSNPNAAAYWSAFLWPARISPDFFKLIEADCLAALKSPNSFTSDNYKRLCQVFLLASMEFKATSSDSIVEVLNAIGTKGLEHMSSYIRQRMLNSKDDVASYWEKIVLPWIDANWPRDYASQSQKTRENFAMIAIYSDTSFPTAIKWMEKNGLLGEIPTALTILSSLKYREDRTHDDFQSSSTLPQRYPRQVLRLMWLTRPFKYDHQYGTNLLDILVEQDATLANTEEYLELKELI